MLCDDGSITGVPVMPVTGPREMLSHSRSSRGAVFSSTGMRFTLGLDHTALHPRSSASKAYRLSFSVAMKTTLCRWPLICKLAIQRGWAKTHPSTGHEKIFPNLLLTTFSPVRAYSWEFTPECSRSFRHVATPTRSVTPTLANALLVASALLVAVIV